MPFKYVFVLPILCLVWFVLTFITTYLIAVFNKNVVPVFPYISDTGAWSPESCIFGLMLNFGALIQAVIVYVRYLQVNYLAEKLSSAKSMYKLNRISLVLGILAPIGVCLVGNFQETNVLTVHVLGAIVAFGGGAIYFSMQTRVSFKIYPDFGNKTVNILRLLCSIICSVTFIITFIFAGISFLQFTGDDITKWKPEDGGYVNHFISAVAEWIMALTSIFFLFLYTGEFKSFTISPPEIKEKTSQTSSHLP